MYIPSTFRETDADRLHAFLHANSFALLVNHSNQGLEGSHLPLLFEPKAGPHGSLFGHMARANTQWQRCEDEVLAIFSGPHAYVSPSWYGSPDMVPTWNYLAVHVRGRMETIDEPGQLLDILKRTVDRYERTMPQPWSFSEEDPFIHRLLAGIVGFRIEITSIEGKWKLNQNHPVERRKNVIRELVANGSDNQTLVARFMRETLS